MLGKTLLCLSWYATLDILNSKKQNKNFNESRDHHNIIKMDEWRLLSGSWIWFWFFWSL